MAGDSPRPQDTKLPRIGSYDLIQPLGSGGMSSVYRARHVETGLEVAIKILPRTLAKNPTVLQRFLREAKSAEALEHPNIVAIYDRGIDQGRYYLVLEYLADGDLHDRVRADGPMPIPRAIAIVRSVAGALSYASERGLIHRDIKPANLLLCPTGEVKVADLGLALQAEGEDERVTREGTTVGTVDYMAPEQARDSRATSSRSDIYSLGCTFYFLLTGQPPFPGGDVADKLNRHINAPPPDVRLIRPEVGAPLANLLKRMLAKKPEGRFADFAELIRSLDALNATEPDASKEESHGTSQPTLTALFANEASDDSIQLAPASGGFIPLVPADEPTGGRVVALPALRPSGASSPIPLSDLVGDDDLSPPDRVDAKPEVPMVRGRGSRNSARPEEAELVPLDEEERLEDRSIRSKPVDRARVSTGVVSSPVVSPARRMSESDRSWITMCVLLGVGLLFLVIAVDVILRSSQSSEGEGSTTEAGMSEPRVVQEFVPGAANFNMLPERKTEVPSLAVNSKQPVARSTESSLSTAAIPSWQEPTDPSTAMVPEPEYGSTTEARYLPNWLSETQPKETGKVATVRRWPDPKRQDERGSLRLALEIPGIHAIELAENGAFFEAEPRMPADGRVIRNQKGFRPVVNLVPKSESNQSSRAWIELGERSLEFQGIDFIVDLADFKPGHVAFVSSKGGSVTFRDCSITVVNRNLGRVQRSYSVVRTEGATASAHVLFERCFVRGVYSQLVDVSGGPAEVAIIRSVVLNGQGGIVGFSAPQPPPGRVRRVCVLRSIAVTWGAAFDLNDAPPGSRPHTISLRSLGSTFAHFQSPQGESFIHGHGETNSVTELIDWQGESNVFHGWSNWLTTTGTRSVRLPNLNAVRSAWRGTEGRSEESTRPWPPLPPTPDRVLPTVFLSLAAGREAILSRIPTPSHWIHERTIDNFKLGVNVTPARAGGDTTRSASGSVVASNASPAPPGSLGGSSALLPPKFQTGRVGGMGGPTSSRDDLGGNSFAGALVQGPTQLATTTAVPGTHELVFDTNKAGGATDLGQFINLNTKSSDVLIRVRVTGNGSHPLSPIRLPVGVSLEIEVVPDNRGVFPTWFAPQDAVGQGLIEVRHAGLLLSHFSLSRDAGSKLRFLLDVEEGNLALHQCRLSGPATAETGGGGLVAFRSPSTRPLYRRHSSTWPFDVYIERPTFRAVECLLQTGGDAISSEMGRGWISISECVLIAGGSVFSLQPAKVARDRFDVDLQIERSTLTTQSAFVNLASWPGSNPGPDRPWVISTTESVFFGQYEQSENDASSVMLRVDSDALGHGTVVWQSYLDAIEPGAFLATSDGSRFVQRKPDFRTQWATGWGEKHVRGSTGPRAPYGLPSHRPVARLIPHSVKPSDLVVDPNFPSNRGRDGNLGADLSRLGIAPSGGRR